MDTMDVKDEDQADIDQRRRDEKRRKGMKMTFSSFDSYKTKF